MNGGGRCGWCRWCTRVTGVPMVDTRCARYPVVNECIYGGAGKARLGQGRAKNSAEQGQEHGQNSARTSAITRHPTNPPPTIRHPDTGTHHLQCIQGILLLGADPYWFCSCHIRSLLKLVYGPCGTTARANAGILCLTLITYHILSLGPYTPCGAHSYSRAINNLSYTLLIPHASATRVPLIVSQ